jgi:PAS domain-containing protein
MQKDNQLKHTKNKECMENPEMIFFEHNPVPMFITDSQTRRFLLVNKAAIEIYGYSKEEFYRMDILNIHPEGEKRTAFPLPHIGAFRLQRHRRLAASS